MYSSYKSSINSNNELFLPLAKLLIPSIICNLDLLECVSPETLEICFSRSRVSNIKLIALSDFLIRVLLKIALQLADTANIFFL